MSKLLGSLVWSQAVCEELKNVWLCVPVFYIVNLTHNSHKKQEKVSDKQRSEARYVFSTTCSLICPHKCN